VGICWPIYSSDQAEGQAAPETVFPAIFKYNIRALHTFKERISLKFPGKMFHSNHGGIPLTRQVFQKFGNRIQTTKFVNTCHGITV
jgi:hypothetical protein